MNHLNDNQSADMANSQDDELQVLCTQPHHRTEVIYPEYISDDMEWNNTFVPISPDASQRYFPNGLIRRMRLEAHTDRFSPSETVLYTMNAASANFDRAFTWELDLEEHEYSDLVSHMSRLQMFSGCTRLRVGTVHDYGVERPEKPSLIGHETDRSAQDFNVRVRRETVLYLHNQDEQHLIGNDYEFSVDELRRRQSEVNAPSWARLILQVVLRTNDLTVRHVEAHVTALEVRLAAEVEDEDYVIHNQQQGYDPLGDDSTWKPRRPEDLVRILNEVVMRVDPEILRGEDISCVGCSNDIGSGDVVDPVVLPCHSSHVMCFECLTNWAGGTGAEKARCPLCKAPLFNEQQKIEGAYGLYAGIFRNDDRYKPWENFQRSCADLDEEWVKDRPRKEEKIMVHPDLIFRAIQLQLQGARLEDESSTPRQLQIVRSRDFVLAVRTLEGLLAAIGGRRAHYRCLFFALRDGVLRRYHIAMRRANLHRVGLYRQGYGRPSIELGSELDMLDRFLRPGLEDFVELILNRALQFMRLRHCECGTPGIHKHGDRDFYNKAMQASPTWHFLAPLPPDVVSQLYDADSFCSHG